MAILKPDLMRKVLQSALDDAGVAHTVDFSMIAHVKWTLGLLLSIVSTDRADSIRSLQSGW